MLQRTFAIVSVIANCTLILYVHRAFATASDDRSAMPAVPRLVLIHVAEFRGTLSRGNQLIISNGFPIGLGLKSVSGRFWPVARESPNTGD